MRTPTLFFLLLGLAAAPASGQWIARDLRPGTSSPSPHEVRLDPVRLGPSSPPHPLAPGGVLGGATGLAVGALTGLLVESAVGCSEDPCGLTAISGAVLGGSSGIPVGVHLWNEGRGNLLLSMGASFTILAGGLTLLYHDPEARSWKTIAVAVPVGQLVSAVAIERRTGRHHP